jgi:hypothetical protein
VLTRQFDPEFDAAVGRVDGDHLHLFPESLFFFGKCWSATCSESRAPRTSACGSSSAVLRAGELRSTACKVDAAEIAEQCVELLRFRLWPMFAPLTTHFLNNCARLDSPECRSARARTHSSSSPSCSSLPFQTSRVSATDRVGSAWWAA